MSPKEGGSVTPAQKIRAGIVKSRRQGPHLGKGAEHCSLGLGLSRALLHSIQSGKVQIGLEVMGNHPAWPSGTSTRERQRGRCPDLLRVAGALPSSGSGTLPGLLRLHTRGSSEEGTVSPGGRAL